MKCENESYGENVFHVLDFSKLVLAAQSLEL